MSIFQNKEYIKLIKNSQYAKILLDNILTKEEKKKKLESLIKIYFLLNVEKLQDIQISEEYLNLSYNLLNIADINKDYISKITHDKDYYNFVLNKKHKDFLDLNILNNVPDLNLFFICEISISDKIPNKSLKLKFTSPHNLGLFYSENNYKGYFIFQLSESSLIQNILSKSFKE